MLILISPAKTLDFETKPSMTAFSQPQHLDRSQSLIDRLRKFDAVGIAKLMSLSDQLASLNVGRYETWQAPFSLENAKQALLAFKGDVYAGLDAETMTNEDFEYAQKHLRILSGLYGVLKPLDLMQPYRLEMGIKLDTAEGKNLYEFWGSEIRETLLEEPAMQDQVLINLASNEYFKVLQVKKLNVRVITPVFKDWKNGQYKMISFYAKRARGLMSRYIVDGKFTAPDALKQFDYEGYRYSEDMSEGDEWVFIRDHA